MAFCTDSKARALAAAREVGAIAGGEDVRRAGTALAVHENAGVDGEAGGLRQIVIGQDADADDGEIRRHKGAVLQPRIGVATLVRADQFGKAALLPGS